MKVKEKIAEQELTPVILGGGDNALGLVWSFGEKNISSIVVDSHENACFHSRYVQGVTQADPVINEALFINQLYMLGSKIKRGFLLATGDEYLIPISKHRKKLQKHFEFPMSDWETIRNCSDKKLLYSFAEEHGIPYPKTYYLNTISESKNYNFQFPIILKPTITVGFLEKLNLKRRTLKIFSKEEFSDWVIKLDNLDLGDMNYVVQEYIPGSVENLYTITSYSNKKGDIVAYSTGYKIRQRPPDAGTILSGRVEPQPQLYELGKKLIKLMGFYGIANTEFKKDDRDGVFKLIEINPRPGKWNRSVLQTGINMPYMAYSEILGNEINGVVHNNVELVWISLIEDFYNALFGFKRKGFPEHSLSLLQYVKSIKGKKVVSSFNRNDLMPFIYNTLNLLRSRA